MSNSYFEVELVSFESPALRDNPLGDPHVRDIPVILPRGYGESSRRYPVIYVLVGYGSSGQSLLNWKAWSPTLAQRLDTLRESGAIGDCIVVSPDGFTKYGGSQYLNSSATGNYEDMLVKDLTAWIDGRYPTLPSAAHRGIVGKSSGGYAALTLGMRHPDVFSAVGCHSGDMYFDYCYRHDFPYLLRQMDRYGSVERFLEAFYEDPEDLHRHVPGHEHDRYGRRVLAESG